MNEYHYNKGYKSEQSGPEHNNNGGLAHPIRKNLRIAAPMTFSSLDLSRKSLKPLLFTFLFSCISFLLLSCGELDSDAPEPQFGYLIFAGSGDGSFADGGFADGQGVAAQFNRPEGVAVAPDGTLYVADQNNHRIRKITPSGLVSTFAGSGTAGFADGQGAAAKFAFPAGIASDRFGNLYVADSSNHRIRKITPSGLVSTVAGGAVTTAADGSTAFDGYKDAQGTEAQFHLPYGIAVGPAGNLYVTEISNRQAGVVITSNHRIRKITPSGLVSTFAGSGIYGFDDGQGTAAQFRSARGIAVAEDGTLYIGDTETHNIRKVTPSGLVSTFAGATYSGSLVDGQGTSAVFFGPQGVSINPKDGKLYVTAGENIRRVVLSGSDEAKVTTIMKGLVLPADIAFSPDGSVAYFADKEANLIYKLYEPSSAPDL